jgi:hypothetical protein
MADQCPRCSKSEFNSGMSVTCSLKVTLPRAPIHSRLGSRSAATATRRLESHYASAMSPRLPGPSENYTHIVCDTSPTLRRVVSMCFRSIR